MTNHCQILTHSHSTEEILAACEKFAKDHPPITDRIQITPEAFGVLTGVDDKFIAECINISKREPRRKLFYSDKDGSQSFSQLATTLGTSSRSFAVRYR